MTTTTFTRASAFGPSSVLKQVTEDLPQDPPAGMLRIRQKAVGINFIDVLARRGDLGGAPPYRLGLEAAGVVEAAGPGVEDFQPGSRVVYAGGPAGSYADVRDVPASRIVALPPSVSFEDAAAVFFKGLTADYLVHRLRPLAAGDWVLLHGAAGGLAALLVPLLVRQGVRVFGTVGSAAKAEAARQFGCTSVAVLGQDDIAARVRAEAPEGVAVAYDPIGRATFEASFSSLARFGLLVSFGWASGDPEPIPLARLRDQGSVFVTRPTVSHYTERRDDLVAGAKRVFEALESKTYRAVIDSRFGLEEASAAHDRLEKGLNRGQVVLVA